MRILSSPLPVNIIMLDNMSLMEMKNAVKMRDQLNPKVMLEASGNVDLYTILPIAKTGVDFISVGKITHSVKALDFSLIVS